jgi:lactate permease
MIDFLVSLFPIALLIWMMTKRKSIPSFVALPISAVILYGLRFLYFGSELTLINAGTIAGVLTAFVPILVVWGAVLLFQLMKDSGALKTIHTWLETITTNKVAQIMIVGWAFSFFIEGTSGFGTPVALAAPILVGLGFNPVRVIMLCLVMNTVPVSFGAVGMPTWFGLGNLELTTETLLAIGNRSALIHSVAGLIIPFLALRFLVSWKEIRKNIGFIFLSLLACIVPYALLSFSSVEFPSLLGGAIGLLLSVFLAKRNVGLVRTAPLPKKKILNLGRSFFPLVGTIVVLLATRIEPFGLKYMLTTSDFSVRWQTMVGEFFVNPSLVLQWRHILGTDISWSHALLYVPSFIPFLLVVLLSFWVLNVDAKKRTNIFRTTFQRMKKPALALFGALIFVKLLMVGDDAPAFILGNMLADITGNTWSFFAPFLGALGSFFSGSNTVANLTFGGIQLATAQSLELSTVNILALQNVGGAMGNMVSIQNIVAGCAILGLVGQEGVILKKTIWPLLVYGVIAGVMGVLI